MTDRSIGDRPYWYNPSTGYWEGVEVIEVAPDDNPAHTIYTITGPWAGVMTVYGYDLHDAPPANARPYTTTTSKPTTGPGWFSRLLAHVPEWIRAWRGG